MKPIFLIVMVIFVTDASGQVEILKSARNWKLYNISDENAFEYRMDTLKSFLYTSLSADTMQLFLAGLTEMTAGGPHVWMGAYIATYEFNGRLHKVEISHYGGILYDEPTKRHYQIPENKIQDWLAFIRNAFIQSENGRLK